MLCKDNLIPSAQNVFKLCHNGATNSFAPVQHTITDCMADPLGSSLKVTDCPSPKIIVRVSTSACWEFRHFVLLEAVWFVEEKHHGQTYLFNLLFEQCTVIVCPTFITCVGVKRVKKPAAACQFHTIFLCSSSCEVLYHHTVDIVPTIQYSSARL